MFTLYGAQSRWCALILSMSALTLLQDGVNCIRTMTGNIPPVLCHILTLSPPHRPSLFQAVTWLGSAFSAAYPPAYRPNGVPVDTAFTAAVVLIRMLTRRVPFESKPTLLAVEEAAELAAKNQGTRERRSKGQHIAFRPQEIVGGDYLGPLVSIARAAGQSPLLPLPAPASPPLLPSEGDKDSKGLPVQNVGMFEEGAEAPGRVEGQAGAAAGVAAVTAGLLLDAFVQSPVAVRRAVEDAVRRG